MTGADHQVMPDEELPPFDPKSKCKKCGWSIPDPVAPPPKVIAGGAVAKPAKPGEKAVFTEDDRVLLDALVELAVEAKSPAKKPAAKPAAPTGILHQEPAPPPTPPTVWYCSGVNCPWDDDEDEPAMEHLHQICDVCGYEWLAKPLG